MKIAATTIYSAEISKVELIAMLKEARSDNVAVQSLPHAGLNVDVELRHGSVVLRWEKERSV